jgi:arylsulfatase A-like enzyme
VRFEQRYQQTPESDLLPPDFPSNVEHNDFRHYSEAVSHLDEQVGRILEALTRQGLADSTVVVFLGDNGAMMGERGVGAKGARVKVVPYESSVRVPLIIRAPGVQGFSGSSDASISTLDLPPTLLALAGQPPPTGWPGRDMRPALQQTTVEGFEDAFSEWADDRSEQFGDLAHRLVRTATHKLIVWKDPSKGRELYALADDPQETTNVAGKPELAPLERDLERRLRRWLEITADPDLGRWLPETDPPSEPR